MEVQHVAETAVCQRWAEDGNVVLPRPVVDGSLVVDFLAEPVDDLAWCPVERLVCLLAGFLLFQHRVQNGHHPVLERAVVAVRDNQIADAIHALCAQTRARRGEGTEVGRRKALDEVLLDAARRGDNGGDMPVLDKVPQCLAQARGDEIRRVAQKHRGAVARLWVAPCALWWVSRLLIRRSRAAQWG